MCGICGCSEEDEGRHVQEHRHSPSDAHRSARLQLRAARTLKIEQSLLSKNQRFAQQNRAWLAQRSCRAVNLMGSPGAGKTALLEALARCAPELPLAVIEGDQATERDAERVRRAGYRALQLNTGTGCHLDAHAVGHALVSLAPEPGSTVILENVGNLVCPALFDLGESVRVVVLSVSEGDDKPLKYPHMFRSCDVLVLNKVDLLPYVDFDVHRTSTYARQLNPELKVFAVSATRGDAMASLADWLRSQGPER
ncbi:MAG TPA: hydrogenase nickel incorporation protein HypB [Polyangiaceae bacterium]|nr:hydrogenase nickel incorporation protein HypB [Polyangiaceae bacterium]